MSGQPDGAKLVEIGGHFGRRTGRVPVAFSRCSFTLPHFDLIPACAEALLQFELYLRKRSDSATYYEWANLHHVGVDFSLDILWYDLDYFADRKDAYLVGAHPLAFARFGCRPSDMTVVHFGDVVGGDML